MSDLSKPQSRRAPPSWTASLERARADVAAGLTVDAEEFLRRLESDDAELSAADLEVRRAASHR